MSRNRVPGRVTVVFIALLGVLLLAAPSQSAPVTLNFSGTVDLSSVDGGLPVHTFSGSVTWDPAALPFETDPTTAVYDPLSYTLIFDGVDYSAPVIGNGTGSGVIVLNDSDLLTPGTAFDGVGWFLAFRPPFDVSGQQGDLALVAAMVAPTTLFGSTALPGDLGFLPQILGMSSFWLFDPDGAEEDGLIDPVGSLIVSIPGGPSFDPGPISSVPEPTTLALIASGLVGALARTRRTRR
jgi:hypothetical protein